MHSVRSRSGKQAGLLDSTLERRRPGKDAGHPSESQHRLEKRGFGPAQGHRHLLGVKLVSGQRFGRLEKNTTYPVPSGFVQIAMPPGTRIHDGLAAVCLAWDRVYRDAGWSQPTDRLQNPLVVSCCRKIAGWSVFRTVARLVELPTLGQQMTMYHCLQRSGGNGAPNAHLHNFGG